MSVMSCCAACFQWFQVCVFCVGHFVTGPLNLTCLHGLQHFFFEHLFNLYYLYQLFIYILSIFFRCWIPSSFLYIDHAMVQMTLTYLTWMRSFWQVQTYSVLHQSQNTRGFINILSDACTLGQSLNFKYYFKSIKILQ